MNIRELLRLKVRYSSWETTARFLVPRLTMAWILVLFVLPASVFSAGAEGAQGGESTVVTEVGYIQLNVAHTHIDQFFEVRISEEGMVYLPIQRTLELLELYLFNSDMTQGVIEGIIPPDQTRYIFDWTEGWMKNDTGQFNVDAQEYFIEGESLYLAYPLWESWLPVQVEWNSFNLEIYIDPRYKMVSERVQERQEIREQLTAQGQAEEIEVLEAEPRSLAPGIINYQLGLMVDSKRHFYVPELALRYSGPLLYGDLLTHLDVKLNGELLLRSIQLTYRDLADLNLAEITFGDGLLKMPSLLRNSALIKGVTFKSQVEHQYYGLTRIEGDAPKGSEVELYWRGVLLDFQKVEGPTYSFTSVPLLGEYNLFEVRIYTPEGQIKTEHQSVIASLNQLPPGESYYRGGAGLRGKDLMLTTSLGYGVNNKLTAGGGVTIFPTYNGVEKFVNGSGTYQLLPALLWSSQFHYGIDQGGMAYQSGFKSFVGDWYFQGELIGYHNLRVPARDRVYREGQLRFLNYEGVVQVRKSMHKHQTSLGYSLAGFQGFTRQSVQGGWQYQLDYTTRFGLQDRLSFGPAGWTNQIAGEVTVKREGLGQIEGKGQVELARDGLESYQLFGNYRYQPEVQPWSYSVGVGLVDNLLTYMLSGEYRLSDWLVAKGSVSNQNLSVSLSLQETRRLAYPFQKMKGDSLNKGWVQGRVYLDANGNGRWDAGEEGYPKVRLRLDDYLTAETDETGAYFIDGVILYQPMKLEVDMNSLDPMYLPEKDQVWVQVRPGVGLSVDFAILPYFGISGELTGMVGKEMEKLSKQVKVLLVDQSGQEVASCIPEYDGFYVIDQILPGSYQLKVEPLVDNLPYEWEPVTYELNLSYGELPQWYDGYNFAFRKNK